MLRRCNRRHESTVRRYHRRADAVREREIHAVINWVPEGQRQTYRVRADGLVVVSAHRHVGQQGHGGAGFGMLDLSHSRLAPQCIGGLGSHKAWRVQLLPARRQLVRNIRVFFGDQLLDRHARIDDEAHQKLSRWPQSRSSRISTSAGVCLRPRVFSRNRREAARNRILFAAMSSLAAHSRMWCTSPYRERLFDEARCLSRSTTSSSSCRTWIAAIGLSPRLLAYC